MPVNVVMPALTVTTPEVSESRFVIADAATVPVSETVSASSPSIVILVASYTACTCAMVPVNVVTPALTVTTPVVAAARVVISVATIEPVSDSVTASLPKPLTVVAAYAVYEACTAASVPVNVFTVAALITRN